MNRRCSLCCSLLGLNCCNGGQYGDYLCLSISYHLSSQILPSTKILNVPLVVNLLVGESIYLVSEVKACGSACGSGESHEGASCVARGNAVSLSVGQQGGN